jgi:hypothetical protein
MIAAPNLLNCVHQQRGEYGQPVLDSSGRAGEVHHQGAVCDPGDAT